MAALSQKRQRVYHDRTDILRDHPDHLACRLATTQEAGYSHIPSSQNDLV